MVGKALRRFRRQRTCPMCGARLREIIWETRALFWLYGHGHAERTTLLACTGKSCRYVRHVATEAVNPRG